MNMPSPAALRELAEAHGLRMIVLFGSRARGTATARSDVDVAVRLGRAPDADRRRRIICALVSLYGSDRLDVVFLDTAGALLWWRVARTGRPLYQVSPGEFTHFAVRALHRWDDARRFRALDKVHLERLFGSPPVG